jgi:UDP-glucose 4-epimerase
MKIVITGALGHIGSSLIRHLPKVFKNAELILIDDLSTLRLGSLFHLPELGEYRFYQKDIVKDNLTDIVKDADALVHLAAITDAATSFSNAKLVESVNFIGLQKVADTCANLKIPIIFLSSTSVYGSQAEVVDEKCAELLPQSPYADAKLKAEAYLQDTLKLVQSGSCILRFGTICGVSPGMRFHTAVNRFCWQASVGKEMTVWKTAFHQKRPYLDIKDAVRAIAHVINKMLYSSDVYNVVSENYSVSQIIDFIQKRYPKSKITFVESKIMNQLSYEVLAERFKASSFDFIGSVGTAIEDTLDTLGKLH